MSKWLVGEEIRHQVAIAGRVTDAQTGRAVGGALVTISDGPRALTAPDGHFHFLDLPPGAYTLVASLPGAGTRYGTVQVTVAVTQDKDGKYTPDPAELKLPPTTLKGRITAQEKGQKEEPVAMAEVRVVGSGERTYSDTGRPDDDTKGDYLLTGLEIGSRTVRVSAQGYWEALQPVQLGQAGQEQRQDISLTPTTRPKPEPTLVTRPKPEPTLVTRPKPEPTLATRPKPEPPPEPETAPEFTPTQLAGCRLWLTAEAITGLHNGDPVGVWPDRSGHDHQATQTEKKKRPRYQARGIGGQPAVRFAGADDSMTLEFSEPSTDHTFFFAYDQPTPSKHNNFLFDVQAGRLTLDSAQGASPHRIRWQDSIWHSVAEAVTGPQILTWVFSSTTEMAEVLRNGTSLGTDDYIPRSLAGKMTLGPNRSDQYSRLAGSMAAVIYYNRALTPEERQQVEQYLSERFGISLGQ